MSEKPLETRITAFSEDPLHSAAYLNGLRTYLAMPEPVRGNLINQDIHVRPFLYQYQLSGAGPSVPRIFRSSTDFNGPALPHSSNSEMIYLSGYPSRLWLKKLLERYKIDFHFLQRHLDFLPGAQRDWYSSTNLPSRNQHYIRLLIPSIVFFDTDIRDLSVKELHDARRSCQSQLKEKARNFFGDSAVQHGQSIVRQINVHSGDMMVVEQAISIFITKSDSKFRSKYRETMHFTSALREMKD